MRMVRPLPSHIGKFSSSTCKIIDSTDLTECVNRTNVTAVEQLQKWFTVGSVITLISLPHAALHPWAHRCSFKSFYLFT